MPLEKAMAPHSSTLAWKIPWKEEPGRLQSMGSLRVRHDWATSLSCFTFMHWRRKWQPTPVILPGESHGRRNLEGCSPWGHWGLDTTERLHFTFTYHATKCLQLCFKLTSARVQLQQPGNHPEGMSGVGRKWCSLWLEVQDYMFISNIRSSFILWQKH